MDGKSRCLLWMLLSKVAQARAYAHRAGFHVQHHLEAEALACERDAEEEAVTLGSDLMQAPFTIRK